MSGGTPVGGGLMRQRHSQGYASSGDDLEDDASSRMLPPPPIPRARTWIEVLENVLWIASAIFIVYFGDRHSNFIYLLCRDDRIRRTPLNLGMVGVVLNIIIFFYTSLLPWGIRKSDEKWEMLSPSAAPLVLLRVVANLEFLDPSSSVHTVYGLHGYISLLLLDDWDVQTPNRCAPYRLNFLSYN
ncbi:hypothetical protein HHK36_013972 [Tetracentron sinense]|uniref:Uncharacterized protein n=1 Tax=Tetracentron sinense TaxID=13715 RepID=A0A834ZEA3_TETSI|nr:hypothetical protein HHK36_013972 [Tetracentron sinense]